MRKYFVLFAVLLLAAIMGLSKKFSEMQINKDIFGIIGQLHYFAKNQNKNTNQLNNQENDFEKIENFKELKKKEKNRRIKQ